MQRPFLFFTSLFAFFSVGCGGDENTGGAQPESGKISNNYWEGTFAELDSTFVDDVSDGNVTVLRLRDSMQAFSGTLSSQGPDGEQNVFRYKEGKAHGLCVMRDKSGGRTEANYRDGVLHGNFVIFGRDGSERFRWRYDNGRKIRD
ncbi:MAG: hypothetical protein CMI31_10315 [Opitutae bacterium]|nr:hypothetical protein [Opitutae bacterium]|tara:strand:+ start:242 stop:679 length:438 start_codon:yes stop_codon:yes gene_type:complete